MAISFRVCFNVVWTIPIHYTAWLVWYNSTVTNYNWFWFLRIERTENCRWFIVIVLNIINVCLMHIFAPQIFSTNCNFNIYTIYMCLYIIVIHHLHVHLRAPADMSTGGGRHNTYIGIYICIYYISPFCIN